MNNTNKIGGIEFENPFFLAPLAGITDAVMRSLCEDYGAAAVYTEMVSAKGLYYGDKKTDKLLHIDKNAGITAIQLFGSEPKIMAYAATKLNSCTNSILDVNMGCPVPKVVKNGDGAALLKNPDLVYDIIRAMTENSEKPITLKIRAGYDEESINAVEVAEAAEAAGAAAVAVHGRTREQYYQGNADWNIIKKVKENVDIPVIGNGDVFCAADGINMMKETGCDFVMVARGALGNPWIFRELNAALNNEPVPERPAPEEKSKVMLRHFQGLVELKGEYSGIREMRKHAAWYTKGMNNSARLRDRINNIETIDEMREVLKLEKI